MSELLLGDCLEVMRTLPDCSVDAVVTDPPYGLAFMGKRWDYDVPSVEIWAECLRVLKPGGHLLAFAGTRTQHRMAVRIEDAGFEIRDLIAWVYGSGFPKSLDVSKAIDKAAGRIGQSVVAIKREIRRRYESQGMTLAEFNSACGFEASGYLRESSTWASVLPPAGKWQVIKAVLDCGDELDLLFAEAQREVVGKKRTGDPVSWYAESARGDGVVDITAPATPEAQQWAGWGTALKPSFESVTWATKPFPPEGERAKILGNLWKIEARLWLLSSASAAAQNSTSSQSEYGAACATAQWTADDATNTRAALRGLMDTWQCEMATHMSLSIVTSWRRTLEESSKPGSTSTTETESKTTTDWKTLSCCLSQITPESIIQACSLPGGFSANASTAAQIFNASLASLQSTLTLSAIEPATWRALDASQAEAVSPSLEPVVMARKPLTGTVAANVLEHGTGALNVDGCRVGIGGDKGVWPITQRSEQRGSMAGAMAAAVTDQALGRWPANLINDGSDEVVGLFPQTTGGSSGPRVATRERSKGWCNSSPGDGVAAIDSYGDTGSAARFFYTAKASRDDRSNGNTHPTVKPTDLMRYLCRLVTPPGGVVLDPFMGSGSTGKAAMLEGFEFIGIEREVQYHAIAERRIRSAAATGHQPSLPL